jgi:RNA polymerase sigma-70 factor (ECF subfamily)
MDGDLVLLDRWRDGDRSAGEQLFARHIAEIYRFFEHKIGEDAADLAQRTFLACIAARDRFRGQSSFRTYLFAIARNEFFRYLRGLPRGEHVDLEATSIVEIVTTQGTRLARAREGEELRSALRELPVEQQLLLELHYWHDLDAAALGEVLDAPAGTIRVRLLRARAALRQKIQQLGPETAARVALASSDRLATSLSEAEREL